MAQIRGTAGYHLGNQPRSFGMAPNQSATQDVSPLDAIREQTSKIEDFLDSYAEPVKPYVLHFPRIVHVERRRRDEMRYNKFECNVF